MMQKISSFNGPVVIIRGAGELASGVGWVLARTGFRVVMTEVDKPLMVRWPVSFGTAIAEQRWQVEGVGSRLISSYQECEELWRQGEIPVIIDPELAGLGELKPEILVDAILAKRNIGTTRDMATLTIGLGPGFTAGSDVDLVVETNRGHNLARVIYTGQAEPNTGVPGEIGGVSTERVIYSPIEGVFRAKQNIGENVLKGDLLGEMESSGLIQPVLASISGTLRGLLRSETPVKQNVKIGDIDPRGCSEYCITISEKSRAIGTTVLFAISEWQQHNNFKR